MSINLGSTTFGSLYLGSTKVGEAYLGSVKVYGSSDPYNPLNLPYYTVRAQFSEGYTPTASGSATQVSSSPNVWDLTYNAWQWTDLFKNNTDLLAVLGANTHGQYGNVNDTSSMFEGCTNLTSVALFDTSSVAVMRNMFFNCKSITTLPDFDTTKCWDFGQMFYNCQALTACPNISTTYRDQYGPLIVRDMFSGCYAMTSVPLLDLNGAEYTTGMFSGCRSLTTVPLFDLSTVTNAASMFEACASLTTIPQFNLRSATSLYKMFYDCSSLTTVPLIDTRSATTMKEMFYDCSSLTSVAQLNTSSVGNFQSMFYNCTDLASVPLFDTSSATNVSYMFSGCTAVASGSLALYQQMSSQSTPPSTYTQCFRNCGSNTVSGQAELAQIPASWGGTQRAWQNDYYIEVIPTTLSRNVAFGNFYTNNVRQSVTSAQIKDGSWVSLSSYTVDNLNNNASYVYMDIVDGFRAYFTKAADLTSLRYSSSGATVGVNITVYGKRVGSSSWSTVKTKSSTQGGTITITV